MGSLQSNMDPMFLLRVPLQVPILILQGVETGDPILIRHGHDGVPSTHGQITIGAPDMSRFFEDLNHA